MATKTSSFGVSRREVYCKDSRELSFLPDNCLHLMVTSPPYNVGKEYDDDLSLEEYLCLIKGVMKGTVLK